MIRQATRADLEHIERLAESVKYDPESPDKSNTLGYVLDREEYLRRLTNPEFFYVSENDGEVDGFLMCYDNQFLDGLVADDMFHHDGVLDFLRKQETPFVYGESIAVKRELERSGIGKAMMSRLFQDMRKRDIQRMHVLIRHNPDRNEESIDFCSGLDFEYTGKEITNSDNVFTWGVYSLNLE